MQNLPTGTDPDGTLHRLQKLVLIEQLAGGLAHDFNNSFQNILASMELVRKLIAAGRGAETERFVTSAISSAQRAASSSRLWLALLRSAEDEPRRLATSEALADAGELFRRTLRDPTRANIEVMPDLWDMDCDAGELQEAVLNLAIQARDASAGPILIRARNVDVDDDDATTGCMGRGQNVSISVSFPVAGQGDEALRRAFDSASGQAAARVAPGLAIVRHFARRNGGDAMISIEATSATVGNATPAHTTITMLLPRGGSGAREPA